MSRDGKEKTGKVLDFKATGSRPEARRLARREAERKARAENLRNRFASARQSAESPNKAAERLKKVFRKAGPNPSKKT